MRWLEMAEIPAMAAERSKFSEPQTMCALYNLFPAL